MIINSKKINHTEVNSYEIKLSTSHHNVPVVNGIYLHSSIDPVQESSELLKKYHLNIKKNNNLIILGLGFAYHIKAILQSLKEYHIDNYKVVIVEPNFCLIDDCQKYNPLDDNNVTLLNQDIDALYSNKEFIDFLYLRPTLIIHPASYSLNKQFFKMYLRYRAPNNLKVISNTLNSSDLKDYLQKFTSSDISEFNDETIGTFIKYINDKQRTVDKLDYLLMAYEYLK